jgi:hypothetical protein
MEEVLPWKEKWPIGIGVWKTYSRVVPLLILLRRYRWVYTSCFYRQVTVVIGFSNRNTGGDWP